MRHSVIKEKDFIRKVYKSKSFKPLQSAEGHHLKSLLKAVHLVINRKVPLTTKVINAVSKIDRKTVRKLKRAIQNKEKLFGLLNAKKESILKIVKKFYNIIRVFLGSYFTSSAHE